MTRAIRRYAITIAVLGAASVLVVVFGTIQGAGRITYDLPTLEPVSASEVDRLIIERPTESVSLNRSADGWRVSPGNYPAHLPSVRFLLAAMTELNITDVVSVSDDPSRYSLDDESRVRVTLEGGGDQLRVVDIGRRAATYGHAYVSVPGDKRILQAAGELRGAFDRGVDLLRDKSVLGFDTGAVTAVDIAVRTPSGTEEVRVARTDGGWSTGAPDDLIDAEIDGALAFLGSLSAYQFRYADPISGEPWMEVRIVADEIHTISIYGKDGTVYPARTSQTEYEFNMLLFQPRLILTPFGLDVPP